MPLNLKRVLSLLLVLILLAGMIPSAYATETSLPTEETTVPTTEATEPATTEAETTGPIADEEAAAADNGIMLLSGDQYSGVKLLNLASPYNYTCTLSSQVYVKYVPAGTSTVKTAGLKNIGWHYYSYDGVQDKDKTIYCIEPYKDFNQGSTGNYMDQGVDVWGDNSTGSVGSNAWYNLSSGQRSAIAYILQFSELRWDDSYSVTTTSKTNNPNYSLRTATQVLIYEIVTGLRDPYSFDRLDSNGYSDGRVLYDAFKDAVPDFRTYYNGIVSDVQNAELLPSFCGSSSSSAPTITVDGSLTWVTDTNGVCGQFTFVEDNDDIWFNVYDTEVGFQNPYGFTGTKLYSCYKSRPSTGSSRFSVFYSPSSTYQTCVALYSPGTSRTTGYFKVYVPSKTGDLSVTKTTSDGQNLSGWQFSVYSNSACTSLVAGPYSTNSSGKVSFTGLNAGTYYVKEVGHTNSATAAKYSCTSTNPQSVTVTAGSMAAVSFTNKLNTGSVKLVKETNTGKNLDGWKIGLYMDSSCTNAVSGSPFTTGKDGTVTVTGVTPGTYYAKETASSDPYWVCDTAVKTVTVTSNNTATVTFTNTHKGRGKIIKSMPDGGSIARWEFKVYSSDNALVGSYITAADGTVQTDFLLPGAYTVKEIIPEGSAYICDAPNPKTITITPGQIAEVTFTNRMKSGEILIHKVDTHGQSLAGALFLLEWSADGSQWQTVTYTDSLDAQEGTCTSEHLTEGTLTSGEDGLVRFTGLDPGSLYRVTETKAPEGYQLLTEPAYEGSIRKDNECSVQLTVVNAPVFELPMTGSMGRTAQKGLQIVGALILLILLTRLAKKRR